MMLQPGLYRYPFNFQIPPNAPSSFAGIYGSVRYYVNVTLEKPGLFSNENGVQYFTVVRPLDLNTAHDVMVRHRTNNFETKGVTIVRCYIKFCSLRNCRKDGIHD